MSTVKEMVNVIYGVIDLNTLHTTRNEPKNAILMTQCYPDLNNASDWFKQISPVKKSVFFITQVFIEGNKFRFHFIMVHYKNYVSAAH